MLAFSLPNDPVTLALLVIGLWLAVGLAVAIVLSRVLALGSRNEEPAPLRAGSAGGASRGGHARGGASRGVPARGDEEHGGLAGEREGRTRRRRRVAGVFRDDGRDGNFGVAA